IDSSSFEFVGSGALLGGFTICNGAPLLIDCTGISSGVTGTIGGGVSFFSGGDCLVLACTGCVSLCAELSLCGQKTKYAPTLSPRSANTPTCARICLLAMTSSLK